MDRPPSVDALARDLADTGLPHPLLVDCARRAIASASGSASDDIAGAARADAAAVARSLLQPVINATGVLLHTNLGRAPLAYGQDGRYANLELDLGSGRRGSRSAHAAGLLARLCDAEAALVVNNGAAAVLLVLAALAHGQDVAVSRGELVEIGGGFRVPEVLAQSGARLVEVGTTNRTRLADYAGASPDLVLKVHQSNYRIVGFTESVAVRDLETLGVPVVADIGSGLVDAACPWLPNGRPGWLSGEPASKQTLADGAALVTFSGDKLFGGPQAGVIAGQKLLVETCARHPLARALRPGQMVLGALQETALAYLRRDGMAIPFWRMASVPVEELRARAASMIAGEVVACESVPGGGTVPGLTIPSAGVALDGDHAARLRAFDPPVIARVVDGRTVLDLRTVDPADDNTVAKALSECA